MAGRMGLLPTDQLTRPYGLGKDLVAKTTLPGWYERAETVCLAMNNEDSKRHSAIELP